MIDKERKKFLKRKMGYIFLRFFAFVNGAFPLSGCYGVGRFIGSSMYTLIARQRRIALESLSLAFPSATLSMRKKIAKDFFIFLGQSSLELLYFLRNLDRLKGVALEGKKHLDDALKEGRGVIILTAHMGNFPLMSLKLASAGYPVYIVTRPMRDPNAGGYLYDLWTRAKVKTIFSYPRRDCVSGIIKALRNNEIVIIQMDQNFGTGGVWVKFFGKLAATPVGPIVFALRTKAKIIPAYTLRKARGKHVLRFFPEEKLILSDDKDETVLLNAIKFTRIIEGWIKDRPYQWGWIHRRWKSRPSEKVNKLKFKVEKI